MHDKRDFLTPVDPADRPVLTRATARLLVLDPAGRVLLFCDHDPNVPEFRWWNTPGGGIDSGETPREAAVRELREETGYDASSGELLGPLATRRVVHGYSDCVVDQADTFFAVRVPAFDVEPAGLTEAEVAMMLDHRWWDLDGLAASGERVWPAELAELCAVVERPGDWPLRLDPAEESSVPAGGLVAPITPG